MSIRVALDELRAAIEERGGGAYVLTVSDDTRPHAVHVHVEWQGNVLTADVGKRTGENALARPIASLLFPVRADGDYSLIVDGTVVVAARDNGHRLLITPTKAVLHRPTPSPDPLSSCDDDCVPLMSR